MRAVLEAGGIVAICLVVGWVLVQFLKPEDGESEASRDLRRIMTGGCWIFHGGRTLAFIALLVILLLGLGGS